MGGRIGSRKINLVNTCGINNKNFLPILSVSLNHNSKSKVTDKGEEGKSLILIK